MRLPIVVLAGMAAAMATVAKADEGMWTFDNFPSAAVNAKYRTSIDQAWLARVRGAAVRLSSGCSASLVSGRGLVLTNHHCVRDCAVEVSPPDTDYIEVGFIARTTYDHAEAANEIIDRVRRIHDHIKGTLPDGTPYFRRTLREDDTDDPAEHPQHGVALAPALVRRNRRLAPLCHGCCLARSLPQCSSAFTCRGR